MRYPNKSPALILGLLGTAKQTSSPRGNETSLLTLGGVAGDGGGLADMLVVTTTVRLEEIISAWHLDEIAQGSVHGQPGSWQHHESWAMSCA
jgi:hypothetical protein